MVRHYSADGTDLGVFASDLSAPAWITTDRTGTTYVSEYRGNAIRKFSPSGALLLTVPTSFTPGGVAIGDDRSIYVAHYDAGKIHRFSATGADLGIFASYAGCDTGCGTDFIKFDADGNLFVADLQPLGRVRLISPEGTDLGNFVTTNIPGGVEGLGFDARGISTSPTLATPASASSRRSRRREKISGRSRRRYATASPSIARAIFTRRRARVPSRSSRPQERTSGVSVSEAETWPSSLGLSPWNSANIVAGRPLRFPASSRIRGNASRSSSSKK